MQPTTEPRPAAPPHVVHPRPGSVRLSRWLVTALAVWALLDVAGRLGPVGWLHVLPEHEATRRPGRYHPFIPGLSLSADPWVGETALTGNLAPTETRPAARFSTDGLGFRLTPGVRPGDDVRLILYGGSSFAYGGGLADGETFPAVLTRETGRRVYNGGHFWWDPLNLRSLDWLTDHLGGTRPGVVMLHWEDADPDPRTLQPGSRRPDRVGRKLLGRDRYRDFRDFTDYARRYAGAVWGISPVEVLSIRLFKALSNDRVLPNRYKAAVRSRELPGGRRILFLEEEVVRVLRPPGDDVVRRHGEYYEAYARHLAARGAGLYVILLPNRYTLYGPLVDGASAAPADPYLDRLERELERRGVAVMNGLPVLRPLAAGDVASGRLSFYREDHHWSPLGVERIARAFDRFLDRGGPRGARRTDAL